MNRSHLWSSVCLLAIVSGLGGCALEPALDSDLEQDPSPPNLATKAQALVSGTKPLLVIMLRDPNTSSLAHDKAWYRSRLFGTGDTRSVTNYFTAVSRGKFNYSEAGILSFVNDSRYDEEAKIDEDEDELFKRQMRARYFAGRHGFNYAAYDKNRDGRVTDNELTMLVIDNYSRDGGKTPYPGCTDVLGLEICSAAPLVGHESSMMNYAHELVHALGIDEDLYGTGTAGPTGDRCLSQDATLMSCTRKHYDADFGYYLDPLNRARLGWLGPSQSRSVTYAGNDFIVSAVGNPWAENEVVKVTNQFNEALTFELRGLYSPYDDKIDIGLYAWYSKVDANGKIVDIPSLDQPTKKVSAMFTLAPTSNCALNPSDLNSRGMVAPLQAGEYVWSHQGGLTSFYINPVLYGDNTYLYEISWDSGLNTNRQCGQNDAGATIRVYQHSNFGGTNQTFGEGSWDVGTLNTIGNDQISSLKVSAGAVATLCSEHHHGGTCVSFTGSHSYIGDLLNDRVSSIQLNKLW